MHEALVVHNFAVATTAYISVKFMNLERFNSFSRYDSYVINYVIAMPHIINMAESYFNLFAVTLTSL